MAPHEPPTEITVRVKVPPGHIHGAHDDEYSLGVLSTDLPISALRQRIQTLIPGNPTPPQQRILHGGRALVDDTQSIADALNTRRDPSQTEYVIHLLIRGGNGDHGHPDAGGTHGRAASAQLPAQPRAVPVHGMAAPPTGMLPPAVVPPGVIPPGIERQLPIPGLYGMPGMAGVPANGLVHGVPHHQLGQNPGQNNQAAQQLRQQSPTANSVPLNAPVDPQTTPQPQAQPNQNPNQPHQNPQHRPISGQGFHLSGTGPNGQRFAIHQQTLNFPGVALPGGQYTMPMPQPPHAGLPQIPGLGLPFPMPGMPQQMQQPGQTAGVTALDRARENMIEMRRTLEAMRNENSNSEGAASRVADMEQRMQAISDYIDPFRLGGRANTSLNGRPASQPPTTRTDQTRNLPESVAGTPIPLLQQPQFQPPQFRTHPGGFGFTQPGLFQQLQQPPRPTPLGEVTAYLLSSPNGPHALLLSPQHGTYSGSLHHSIGHPGMGPRHPGFGPQPTPVTGVLAPPDHRGRTPLQPPVQGQAQGPAPPQDPAPRPAHARPADGAQEQPAAQQAQQAQQADPLGPLQPILGHLWLLFRIMIFAYFILGSSMGWRRPVALALIGLGFWMIRLGLFGDGGIVRRWWDGLVRIEDVRDRLRRQGLLVDGAQAGGRDGEAAAAQGGDQGTQGAPPPGERNAQNAPAGRHEGGPMPTPEELAQRLINERRQNLQAAPLHRLREQIRPVERAVALFVASLWPGVGERYVQALDRNREAEEIARRDLERQSEEAERREAEAADVREKKEEPSVQGQTGEEGESAALVASGDSES